MGGLGDIFLLGLVAMFNPTLLAATTVMLLMPNPKRLMLGYLIGAYTASITLGLLIVFTLHNSTAVRTSKHTISPAEDLVLGSLALVIAFVLGTGRDQGLQNRRAQRKERKEAEKRTEGKPTEPLPIRLLGRGSPRITFVVGLLLSFPGVSYLAALDRMDKLNASAAETVLLVIGFCLIQQMFLELPLISFFVDPAGTRDKIDHTTAWVTSHGRRAAMFGSAVIGALLIARGLAGLL